MANSQPNLLKDRDGVGIQTLIPDHTSVAQAVIGAGNARTALPADAVVVEVCASDFCRFAFGDASVDATAGTVSLFSPARVVYRVPPGATDFAVTQLGSTSGFVTVTRLY